MKGIMPQEGQHQCAALPEAWPQLRACLLGASRSQQPGPQGPRDFSVWLATQQFDQCKGCLDIVNVSTGQLMKTFVVADLLQLAGMKHICFLVIGAICYLQHQAWSPDATHLLIDFDGFHMLLDFRESSSQIPQRCMVKHAGFEIGRAHV